MGAKDFVQEIREYGPVTEWRWSSESPLVPQPFWTSCYLVDGLLVDCGAPDGVEALASYLDALPDGKFPERCFVTHAHEDHAGAARHLTEVLGVPTFASPKALPILHAGREYADYRRMTWGPRLEPASLVLPLEERLLATPGGKFEFEAFPVPDHAPCLVALLEPGQQWAFVADAIQPKYQMVFGSTMDIPEDVEEIHRSIAALEARTEGMDDLCLFLPGRRPVRSGRPFLARRRRELELLHERAHELAAAGLQVRKIVKKLFGGESFVGTFTWGDLSRVNLVRELLRWPLES
ncbi:MAG: MBL fold metallo-hydrolase [Promethearchaeota archaeon]